MLSAVRDVRAAVRARRAGARYALRIVREARRSGVDPALALALVERESDFRNVFGNDLVTSPQARGGRVTRGRYRLYRDLRERGYGAQGIGLTQLTWPSFQDAADGIGGCWKPRCQLRVGFDVLAEHIRTRGERAGLAAYTGGARADRYAAQVLDGALRWGRILTDGG
jgi:hypothetical protein